MWRPLLEKAEVRHVRVHDARHTYASLMLRRGVPPAYVQSPARALVDPGHRRPVRALHPETASRNFDETSTDTEERTKA